MPDPAFELTNGLMSCPEQFLADNIFWVYDLANDEQPGIKGFSVAYEDPRYVQGITDLYGGRGSNIYVATRSGGPVQAYYLPWNSNSTKTTLLGPNDTKSPFMFTGLLAGCALGVGVKLGGIEVSHTNLPDNEMGHDDPPGMHWRQQQVLQGLECTKIINRSSYRITYYNSRTQLEGFATVVGINRGGWEFWVQQSEQGVIRYKKPRVNQFPGTSDNLFRITNVYRL